MIAAPRDLQRDPDAAALSDRELFHRLLNPEGFVELLHASRHRIQTALSKCSTPPLHGSGLFPEPFGLDRNDFPAVEIPADLNFSDCQTLIRQFAPAALLGQCWLQRYPQAVNGHTDLAAALFRVYRAGLDLEGRNFDIASYRVFMWQLGIDLPPIDSHAFCEHDQLSEAAFRHALVRLCLARCTRDFPGELIGFTAADAFGLSGIFDENLIRQFKRFDIPDHYIASRIRAGSRATGAVREAVSGYLRDHCDSESGKRRIEAGIRLYVEADRMFWAEFLQDRSATQSPADRVLALFRNKARYGKGFHRAVSIGGIGIDAWFETAFADGTAFLNALARSEWFDGTDPDRSLFFTRVTAPGGAMAGVFTPHELGILRDWLETRRTEGRDFVVSEVSSQSPGATARSLVLRETVPAARPRPTLREMYFRLVHVSEFPEVLGAARDYVEKCLRVTKLALRLIPVSEWKTFRFSHAAFQSRIDSIYRRQVDAYRPLNGKPGLDRDAWIFVIKQFSPTVLVDGCWLQSIHDPGMQNCPVSESLWKIYADEIGNGESRSNHPVIYRRLLESLAIDLPAIDDPRFAHHPDFIAGAFDIPVYLLAVSQFPCSFLPELIGINLAIELSGLGAGYLGLAESLEYWEIDSTIVKVHQSADNMASGHSAIARSVVSRYLDHILSLNGERAMQSHWQRIWLGFVSIRIVPLRFIAHLAWRYLTRRAGTRNLR
ncbi:MAG: iron-containing redox enzyme family protein [Methylococcaceae bacterium]|nr:iron-containing redox enzyme family protein [Methylococcaceae bacterium]